MTCQETAPALGAYVLGALDSAERQRVDDHVRHCPDCARELAGFQAIPPLLHRVRLEDLESGPVTPSPGLFERVAAAAAAERAHRARPARGWLVAAAAVAVLGVGGGVTWWATSPSTPETVHSVVAGSVRMSVTPDPQPDGTVLDVTVAGVAPGEECRLVVVDRAGVRHQAGAWTASYAGDATFRGWTSVHRQEVTSVVLLGTDGHQLVRVPL
jgi:anti-sigma-K factor RskA